MLLKYNESHNVTSPETHLHSSNKASGLLTSCFVLVAAAVDAAKRAREEREKLKRQEVSTLKIQTHWRKALSLKRARREIANAWLLQTQSTSVLKADLLFQALRQFNFFFSNQLFEQYAQSLSTMMRTLAKSILSSEPEVNIAALAQGMPHQFAFQVKKFLLSLQKHIVRASERQGIADVALAIQLISFFTDSASIDKFSASNSVGRLVTSSVVKFLLDNNIIVDICTALRCCSDGSAPVKLPAFAEAQLQRMVPLLLKKCNDMFLVDVSLKHVIQKSSADYVVHFMSLDIPPTIFTPNAALLREVSALALKNAPLRSPTIDDLLSASRFARIMRHIALTVSSEPAAFGVDSIPPLFNSVAAVVDEIDKFTSDAEKTILLDIENAERAANIPVSPARKKTHQRRGRYQQDDDQDEDDDFDLDPMEGIVPIAVPDSVAKQIDSLAAQLGHLDTIRSSLRDDVIRKLYQPSVLRILCSKLSDSTSSTSFGSGRPVGPSASVVDSLSQLIRVATRFVDDAEFLDQIYDVVYPTVLPCWHSVLKPTLIQSPASAFSETSLQRLCGLFCRCLAFALQSCVSEADFYSTGVPFSTKDIVEMLLLLRKIPIYRMQLFGQTLPAGTLLEWDALLADIQELWLQLFRRQWRRSFTQYQNFFIMNLSADDMINSSVGMDRHPILLHCPILIPTAEKVKILHHWLENDKVVYQPSPAQAAIEDWENEDAPGPVFQQQLKVQIRRSHMVEDTLVQLGSGKSLKKKVKVEFIRDDGEPEPGVDGGGLFRELFSHVIEAGIAPDFGLFTVAAENTLFPNPDSLKTTGPDHLRFFEAFGKFVGKSVYERLLLELPISQFFVSTLLNRKVHLSDLIYLDAELSANLFKLTKLSDEDLSDFTFTTTTNTDPARTVELVPGGSLMQVCRENVWKYIRAVAEYKLYGQIRQQAEAFAKGFREVVPSKWTRIFSEDEFLINITGTTGRIDIADLQRNVEFSGGYWEMSPTILLLWEVLAEMDDESHQKFLKFVTSHSRPPILGFKTLEPKFAIKKPSDDADRLPTANTCMNLFKLPPYRTKEVLREKLMYAINAAAGFELS